MALARSYNPQGLKYLFSVGFPWLFLNLG